MKIVTPILGALILVIFTPTPSMAGSGDPTIQHNLALAAQAAGNTEEAYALFKKSCMASEGLAKSCLSWWKLAQELDNTKDIKRALSSAVMLDPDNLEARFAFAHILLNKQDYTWAIEHLKAALQLVKPGPNLALLRYYLGYAYFKTNELDYASKMFSLARAGLSPEFRQRSYFYKGLIAQAKGNREKFLKLMKLTIRGPGEEWILAAQDQIAAISAFPARPLFSGQFAGGLFGINTHPLSAVFDDFVKSETLPVVQTIHRLDVVLAAGSYDDGFQGMLTVYREQNWVEIGEADSSEEESPFAISDLNTTLFVLQAAYLRHTWLGKMENELRFGIDGESQFLDHKPVKDADANDEYKPDENAFGLTTWAVAAKLWWSFASHRNSISAVRLRAELRPNYLEENRSSVRFRLRFVHTQYLVSRSLQLKFMLGGRYDRSYTDPTVVKYDKLLPEGEIKARWRMPIPRVSWLLGIKLKYNWYLNSRLDDENSFRPNWVDDETMNAEQNLAKQEAYLDITRQDFEWEVGTEVRVELWKSAHVAAIYRHHQRLSNMDDAPVPRNDDGQDVEKTIYGYDQDVVSLELRQGF
jgi:tetratricopeptide (TPR) repeat protein